MTSTGTGAPLFAIVASIAGASCSPSPVSSPAPPPSAAASATAAGGAQDAAAEPPPAPPWDAFPTLGNAGAAQCKIARVVVLGPLAEDSPVVAFGRGGGLAAWKQDGATMALQPLSADGAPRGAAVTAPLDADRRVARVFALDGAFVVLLRLWDWQRSDARWWGLVAGPDGQPRRPAADVGLANMDVRASQVIDGRTIALLLAPAHIAPDRDSLHGRWQTLTLRAGGALESKATEVSLDDLVTLTTESWEPAVLAGQRGWVALREGVVRPEGVFAGKRLSSAGAVLLRPKDGVEAQVYSTAMPPPRGPGGRIYEPMPRPALRREHEGKPVGSALDLDASGPFPSFEVVWSGTHFVYPWKRYEDGFAGRLTAVDCAP